MPPKRVVADIMTANPVTVTPRNAIRTAVNLMREGGFRQLLWKAQRYLDWRRQTGRS